MINTTHLLVIIIYFTGVIILGYLFRKKISNFEGYVLADRGVKTWQLSFSMLATFIGGGTLIGLTGRIAQTGISNYWIFVFAGISFIFMGYWGKRLRKRNKFSLPEVIEEHFGAKSKYLIGVIIILAIICFMGVQLKAAGIVLNSITNITTDYAMIIICAIVVLYTWFGGLLADIWTDFLQLVIIIASLIASSFYIYDKIGGFQALKEAFTTQVSLYGPNRYYAIFGQGESAILTLALFFGALMLIGLTISTDPTLHQRIYAAKNVNVVKQSGLIAGIAYGLLGLFIVFVTIGGQAILSGEVQGEQIIPTLVSQILPSILGGLFIAALLSAAMSTLDSDFLLLSTIMVHDFYKKRLNPKADEKELLSLSRILVIFFGIFSLLLAWISPTVLDLLQAAWVFLVATIAVPILFVILRKGNSWGAISSILGGFISALFVIFVFKVDPIQYFLVCVVISLLGMLAGTKISKTLKNRR